MDEKVSFPKSIFDSKVLARHPSSPNLSQPFGLMARTEGIVAVGDARSGSVCSLPASLGVFVGLYHTE